MPGPQFSGLSRNSADPTRLTFSNSRQRTDNLASASLNPRYPTALSLGLTRRFVRGLRYDEPRHRVAVARKNQQLSTSSSGGGSSRWSPSGSSVWELGALRARPSDVQVEAVRLAEKQYEGNRRLAEQGVLASRGCRSGTDASGRFPAERLSGSAGTDDCRTI